MGETTKRRLLWLALLATAVWAGMMYAEMAGYHWEGTTNCPTLPREKGFAKSSHGAISALELTGSAEEFTTLIEQCRDDQFREWNIHVAVTNTGMDFLFIGLYGSALLLFASVLGGRLALLLRMTVIAAMALDVGENVCLLLSLHALERNSSALVPPGFISLPKWVLLGISLVLLAVLFALAKKLNPFWRILMAALLAGAGVLIIAGVGYVPRLEWGLAALGLALLAGLVLYFPIQPFSLGRLLLWIETLYLLRFQVVAGLLLAVILPAGYFLFPGIFVGLFDAMALPSLVCMVWAAFLLAWTVMITTQMVLAYGPDRYPALGRLAAAEPGSRAPAQDLSWGQAGCYAALALPVVVITLCGTSGVDWEGKLLGVLLGAGLSVLVLYLTVVVHAKLLADPNHTASKLYPRFGMLQTPADAPPPPSKPGFVGRAVQSLLPHELTRGIVDPGGRLRSGHQLATTAVVVQLILYAAVGFCFSPISHFEQPAAMFFLLFLLNLLTWGFSGAAFFFDAVRVPVLTVTLALSLLLGSWNTDHGFESQKAPMNPPAAADVVTTWEGARGRDASAAVIVATAGGGIRASAWTAQVLTGMADHCERSDHTNPFSSSLLLVSSVSGGSEGSMWVVGSYQAATGAIDMSRTQHAREASEATALSAVGWGLLYPDFLRTVPGFGSLAGYTPIQHIDRGWALDQEWMKIWVRDYGTKPPTMADWTNDVRAGTRPAVIFNATTAETGERMMIGTTALPPAATILPLAQGNLAWGNWSLQFAGKYPGFNLAVATAARLSATFPWVSPMAETRGSYHFADGGYYDNSGVMSASEWLLSVKETLANRPVILILIDAAPEGEGNAETWSWQKQMVAPIGTLLSVRTSSQVARAEYELALARAYLTNLKVYELSYPPDPLAPLSWHLTQEQIDRIGTSWSSPGKDLKQQRDEVYAALNCPAEN